MGPVLGFALCLRGQVQLLDFAPEPKEAPPLPDAQQSTADQLRCDGAHRAARGKLARCSFAVAMWALVHAIPAIQQKFQNRIRWRCRHSEEHRRERGGGVQLLSSVLRQLLGLTTGPGRGTW